MNLSKNKKALLIVIIHLIGWAIFIKVLFLENTELSMLIQRIPLFLIGNVLLLVGYFYLNMHLFVPRLLSRKKIVAFIGVSLLFLAMICFVFPWSVRSFYGFRPQDRPFPPELIDSIRQYRPPFSMHPDGMMPPDEMRPNRSANFSSPRDFSPRLRPHEMMQRLSFYTYFIQFLVVFIISTGLIVLEQWYREQQKLQELEKSKIQAELSFLKSQIHPHFLFNCLNSIYYLTLSKDDKAPKTVLSLSDFLRFVFIESESDFIPMEKEIKMLEEYLDLQSLRTSEKFELQFIKEGDFSSHSIMPLTFIPFIENAFKYGISAHINCFINIGISMDNGLLSFACDNSIVPATKDNARSSGVGLENIRKRLELMYPERYLLEISEDSSAYRVKLQIRIA